MKGLQYVWWKNILAFDANLSRVEDSSEIGSPELLMLSKICVHFTNYSIFQDNNNEAIKNIC